MSDTEKKDDDTTNKTQESVAAGGWDDVVKPTRKDCPVSGKKNDDPVRIVMKGDAYDDIIAHAKKSQKEEVCGVVVGEVCEDDDGVWVRVEAAIEGTSAKQGGTHVTYTQETWDKIYEVKEEKYSNLNIVGWYHTHPGFGVEFSDMDLFIQQNFFSGPSQFALVIDPVKKVEAACVNNDGAIAHLRGYWVDKKRKECQLPNAVVEAEEEAAEAAAPASSNTAAVPRALEKKIEKVEQRLSQLIQVSDDERNRNGRFLMIVGMFVSCCAVAAIIIFMMFTMQRKPKPPERFHYVEVPIKLGDKTVFVGVSIDKWDIPSELDARITEESKQQAKEYEKRLVANKNKHNKELSELALFATKLRERLAKHEEVDMNEIQKEVLADIKAVEEQWTWRTYLFWGAFILLFLMLTISMFLPRGNYESEDNRSDQNESNASKNKKGRRSN